MITFTQGDTAVLYLTAQDGNGNPINITGATFSTQIKGVNGVFNVFPNSQHAIVDAVSGKFSLTLAIGDTSNCGVGLHKEILTTIVIETTTITYRGPNILTVYRPYPAQ